MGEFILLGAQEQATKAGVIGAGMLLLFVFGEKIHLIPTVTALIGASALLIWIRPDIEEMIGVVDWTTLVFFMSLFIVVGTIQEVGLISHIATIIGKLIGENLALAMIVVTWSSTILSMVIVNIPFTRGNAARHRLSFTDHSRYKLKGTLLLPFYRSAHGRQWFITRSFSQYDHSRN
ncbi:MAG: hypothetical protein HQ574_05590, partial [Chloroflexi bacterium]|nr:hypothetical protein [Chloroflexota bacterium]